ncbi:MAG: metal-dependent transcriptional regulator [bacterium]|nr:metal-dependent transcriptional regulator [bacterium]
MSEEKRGLGQLSRAQEDYLEALLALEKDGGGGVSLSALAERLGVSAPSASEVVQRLQEAGLVERVPRGAIRFTEAGRARAEMVAARHKTIRRFFAEVLRVSPEVAEDDACRAEHTLHAETCERMEDFLAHVAADRLEKDNSVPLTLLGKGQEGKLVRVAGGENVEIRLAVLGLRRGAKVRVLQNSGRGPVMVGVGNARVAIGRDLATRVHIALNKTTVRK